MNENNKIFVTALGITSVVLLYAAIVLYIGGRAERDRSFALQKNLDEVAAAKQDVETSLKEAEISNAQIKAQIKAKEEKIEMLSQRVEEEKTAGAKANSLFQEKDAQVRVLQSKLEQEKQEKEDLTRRLDKLNEDYVALKINLESIMKTKEELEKKSKEAREEEGGISLGTIVVKQSGQ